jgi:hypothetical protein
MTVLSVGILETGVRVVGQQDQDGNFYVGRRPIFPQHLPIQRLEAAVREYRQSPRSLFVEDEKLGWKPNPKGQNELYAYNAAGMRSRTSGEASPQFKPSGVRIAVFGDSFAHGSEVRFDESWAAQVQRTLDRPDRPVEVLNFGVPGYGMDQAFLRWREEGRPFAPHIVVFGLQVENAGRNLNLLRVLYDSADLPFAKPRFVESGGGLDLINVPVPGPEEVVRILRSIEQWALVRHEHYYDADSYRSRPWRVSRLGGMLEELISRVRRRQAAQELPDEQQRLALDIIGRFARDVEASGARFVAVHFPRRADLERARDTGRLPQAEFVEAVSRTAPLVGIHRVLLDRAGSGDLGPLFRPGGHYSPEGNALIAATVADHLRAELTHLASRRAEAALSGSN